LTQSRFIIPKNIYIYLGFDFDENISFKIDKALYQRHQKAKLIIRGN